MIYVGTSGWQYASWKGGAFYPDRLPQRLWLQHYVSVFPTVEVNNSFYRLPKEETFEKWRRETPEGFVWVVKASRYLTHIRRLKEPRDPVDLFWGRARRLQPKLGPVLFQFPPTFKVDVPLLREFLEVLPEDLVGAYEFRHASWYTDEVLEVLDASGAAWVLAHRPGWQVGPVVTGGWSYIRFHQGQEHHPAYGRDALRGWADFIAGLPARDTYVFFNNDPLAAAPADGVMLMELLSEMGQEVAPPLGSPVER